MKNAVNLSIVTYMPIFEGKRLEFVGVKLNEAEKKQFERIGELEDRAMSYVVRELALRGLVLYLEDNRLKPTNEEIERAKDLLSTSDEGRSNPPESSKLVVKQVPHAGKVGGGEHITRVANKKKKAG